MKTRILMTVVGKVQGVSFRRYTAQKARELGVNGWIMNLADGSVQGCFEGDTAAVDALFVWCSIGPERAHVNLLTYDLQPYTGEFTEFTITDQEVKAA